MVKYQTIVLYLLIFLALSVFLKTVGLLEIRTTEIFAYSLIFFGISTVYVTIGKNRRMVLFTGTITFLIGIVLFVVDNFEIVNPSRIIYPSIFFIPGIAVIMLYYDGLRSRYVIPIGAVLIIFGIILTMIWGNPAAGTFINSAYRITIKYWPVVLILIGIIFLLSRDEKR